MKAITVLSYWAWAIVHGEKRVENRSWLTHYRGPLAIHMGQSRKADKVSREFLEALGVACPEREALDLLRGRVIGVCELVACERLRDYQRPMLAADPYAQGPWCWGLAQPRAVGRPVEVGGRLSLWTLPSEAQKQVDAQLESRA